MKRLALRLDQFQTRVMFCCPGWEIMKIEISPVRDLTQIEIRNAEFLWSIKINVYDWDTEFKPNVAIEIIQDQIQILEERKQH